MNGWSAVLASVLAGGGMAAVLGYVKDWRANRAGGRVAEGTAELQIDAARLANFEKRFNLAQTAWDSERSSLLGRIDRLEKELKDERSELERKETKIVALEERVSRVQDELAAVTTELGQLRRGGLD